MKCIIPCAGESSRMSGIPKTLLKVGDKPIISHIVDAWRTSVESFIFILKRSQTYMWELIPDNSAIVFQPQPLGLSDAIQRAKPFVNGKFVIVLGDCLIRGKFQLPKKEMELGIGVWSTNDEYETSKNYTVEVKDGLVSKVKEKPSKEGLTGLCGMGIYFLDTRLFSYIEKGLPTMPPGGGDLTYIIQEMIDNGESISPVYFEGKYINITHPDDLKLAEETW